MIIERRSFLIGLGAVMTAPAIVRASAIMPVKAVDLYDTRCLYVYEIMSDSMVLRVDRALHRMVRPKSGALELPIGVAEKVFGRETILAMQPPEFSQRHIYRQVSTHELAAAGWHPPCSL